MRRFAVGILAAGLASGCASLDTGPETGGRRPHYGAHHGGPSIPGVVGPYGTSVPMAAPYSASAVNNPIAAARMMNSSVPLNMVQMNNPLAYNTPGAPPGVNVPLTPIPAGGLLSPPGVPFGPGAAGGLPIPPTGPMGPGAMAPSPSGIQQTQFTQAALPAPGDGAPRNTGVQQTQFLAPSPAMAAVSGQRTQVRFQRPAGMKVSWFTQGPDGRPMYSATPIDVPGRYNFVQGFRYRLKLENVQQDRNALPVYPTLEVVPTTPKTNEFLSHSVVPVEFTNEDFKQVADGNYLVKVIYLPDPQYQDLAGTGTDEILSTKLEPGQDPIIEAQRRGSILLIIRMGNIDQEASSTPGLNAPGAGGPAGPQIQGPPALQPGMPGMLQMPYWGTMPGQPQGASPKFVPPLPGLPPQVQGTIPAPAIQSTKPGTLPAKVVQQAPETTTSKREAIVPVPGVKESVTITPIPNVVKPGEPESRPSALPALPKPETPKATPRTNDEFQIPEASVPQIQSKKTSTTEKVEPVGASKVVDTPPIIAPLNLPDLRPVPNLQPASLPPVPSPSIVPLGGTSESSKKATSATPRPTGPGTPEMDRLVPPLTLPPVEMPALPPISRK